ncbi:hypothetical protein BO70DRAFT_222927 [Aspergillus heteromorphus CBS 117.55]|uniref:Uncharacterized protein n=1 Tax=Aspergillus heteromorphus CBS 117.55 TaxID=1448321 RepID=A0A317WMF7_9EURO|nr:uncharacterized protein BO70DRAFT_222927 [Aspergillus heteromorphus CBS 117.55]PWY86208.1 hypothetical protein BO70DRAFT_222927 [Aspergillus heteromorphus CBS 117.55]
MFLSKHNDSTAWTSTGHPFLLLLSSPVLPFLFSRHCCFFIRLQSPTSSSILLVLLFLATLFSDFVSSHSFRAPPCLTLPFSLAVSLRTVYN